MKSVAYRTVLGFTRDDDSEVSYDIAAEVVPADPGKTYGPPETCYPPEGGEVFITSIFDAETGTAVDVKTLSDEECEKLCDLVYESWEENYEDSYDDVDDDRDCDDDRDWWDDGC